MQALQYQAHGAGAGMSGEWRDPPEEVDDDTPCRRADCKAWPKWMAESGEEWYTDVVCGRHLMAYISDFAIAGLFGASVTLTLRHPPQ